MRAFHHNLRVRSYGKIVLSTLYFGIWQNPVSYQGTKGRISLFPCYMYRGDWRGKERPFHRHLIGRGNWLWAPPNVYYNICVFSFYIPDSYLSPPQLAGNVFSAFSITEASGISFFSLPHSQSYIYLPQQCLPVSSHDNLHVSGSFSVPLSGPSNSHASADVRTCSSSLHPWQVAWPLEYSLDYVSDRTFRAANKLEANLQGTYSNPSSSHLQALIHTLHSQPLASEHNLPNVWG